MAGTWWARMGHLRVFRWGKQRTIKDGGCLGVGLIFIDINDGSRCLEPKSISSCCRLVGLWPISCQTRLSTWWYEKLGMSVGVADLQCNKKLVDTHVNGILWGHTLRGALGESAMGFMNTSASIKEDAGPFFGALQVIMSNTLSNCAAWPPLPRVEHKLQTGRTLSGRNTTNK